MAEFITVGRVEELPPGSAPLVVEINRRWVAVFNIGGELCAIDDMCTHDEGPLAEGTVEGRIVTCPRHGARFDVCSGKSQQAVYPSVAAYEVQVVDGEIRVGGRKPRS